ncbi:hypothetical protein BC828DRAFT_393132 [Blastocladiella britannica]|nr:hypothetical protein BC828DRAFT_393132 [Blastocladiella britannica]
MRTCLRLLAPIAAIVGVFAVLLGVLYASSPPLSADERLLLRLPRSVDDLKHLAQFARELSRDHFATVAGTFVVVYTMAQTFCIPGSLFLTVLGGALFSLPAALFMVASCTAAGASFSYILSWSIGSPAVSRLQGPRFLEWQAKLAEHRPYLFHYIVFLRVAPLVPNWFINLSSPHLSIPLRTFATATWVSSHLRLYTHVSDPQSKS